MSNNTNSATPESFEGAMAELAQLVSQMESGQLPLEASVAAYARGSELVKYCAAQLEKVESQVKVLEGDMLKLRACLFPDITVSRHRTAVALLHTSAYKPPEVPLDAPPGLPRDWSELAVGQLVIAQENDPADGYWEAIVDKTDGETLSLHWRDFQTLPKFKRPRHAVALLNPVPPTQA